MLAFHKRGYLFNIFNKGNSYLFYGDFKRILNNIVNIAHLL
jgi:hypothetical protein